MLPQGYVNLQLNFTDPLMQAPRGLKRQRRISRHKGESPLCALEIILTYLAANFATHPPPKRVDE